MIFIRFLNIYSKKETIDTKLKLKISLNIRDYVFYKLYDDNYFWKKIIWMEHISSIKLTFE